MAPTQRHILLLTQRAELEAEFKSAVHDMRLRVLSAANGDALGRLLRRGVELVAFDLELPSAVLAEGVAALDQYRDVPMLGLGNADENWDRLLWGSPLKDREREAIEQALDRVGGNRRKAADILGISTRTLYRKLNEYDLQ